MLMEASERWKKNRDYAHGNISKFPTEFDGKNNYVKLDWGNYRVVNRIVKKLFQRLKTRKMVNRLMRKFKNKKLY